MELQNHRRYRAPELEIRFWRTSTGHEVDFVLDDLHTAIEVKGSARIHEGDLRGLQALRQSRVAQRALLVSLERAQRTVDGIEVLPWRPFVERLWAGELLGR
jgi:predicted AAA+ superfamily ATPase